MAKHKEVKKEEVREGVNAPVAPQLKYRVVAVVDYLAKARQYFGEENSWNNAVALIYTENKVVAVIDKKGENKFVVEA